jgi:hypothetical protein
LKKESAGSASAAKQAAEGIIDAVKTVSTIRPNSGFFGGREIEFIDSPPYQLNIQIFCLRLYLPTNRVMSRIY